MSTIDKEDKVAVSGANGYIAMWVLQRGYTVRGTVRSAAEALPVLSYFAGLDYTDKLEIIIVNDITRLRTTFLCIRETKTMTRSVLCRRVHSTMQSRAWCGCHRPHRIPFQSKRENSRWSVGLEF